MTPVGKRRRLALAASQKGQDLVEFALILPLLLAMFLGIMEFGIIILSYNTIANAAREGARYGIIQPDAIYPPVITPFTFCQPDPVDRVIAHACTLTVGLNKSDPGGVQVKVTKNLEVVTVEVRYNAGLLSSIPFSLSGAFPPITIPLATQATMRREQ